MVPREPQPLAGHRGRSARAPSHPRRLLRVAVSSDALLGPSPLAPLNYLCCLLWSASVRRSTAAAAGEEHKQGNTQPVQAAAIVPAAKLAPPSFRLLIFGEAPCDALAPRLACFPIVDCPGKNGWLGGLLGNICKEKGIEFSYATRRLEDKEGMRAELLQKKYVARLRSSVRRLFVFATPSSTRVFSLVEFSGFFRPTHVLNAAGKTGRPNVDWCETHQEEVRNKLHATGWLSAIAVWDLQVGIVLRAGARNQRGRRAQPCRPLPVDEDPHDQLRYRY